MRGILFLQGVYEKSRAAEKAARDDLDLEEAEDGEDGEDGDMVDAPEEEEEEGGEEEEEDVVAEEEEAHARALAERRARGGERSAGGGSGEEEEDDDSLADEPPPEETPLDHLSHLIHVQRALAELMNQPAARPLLAGLAPEVVAGIRGLADSADAELRAGKVAGEFGVEPEVVVVS